MDAAGLSRSFGANPSPEYVAALDAGDVTVIDAPNRVTMLKRLREGAGVHVLTGPEGAAFWLPVSVEVHVDVVPDGYSFNERCEPGMEWALRAVGMSDTLARGLVRHYGDDKEPTAKAAARPKWDAAEALLAEFNTLTTPHGSIVVEASHIEAVVDRAEQLALMDRVENVAADFEWNIEESVGPMFEPEGMSIATADRTWYFPFWAKDLVPEFGYEIPIRAAFQRMVMRTPTVWHNAKADLGTQWQGSPLDAFGAPVHDTLVMAFVAGEHELALKPLTRSLLHRDPLDYPGAMRDLNVETGRRYGGADARNTYDLFNVLYQRLHARQQWAVYDEIERPIIPLIIDMERYGLPVDPAAAKAMRDSLWEEEERIRALFLASDDLDISKDKDIRELVRRRVGYDPGSVKQEALAKIPGEWMDLVMRYRKVRHRRRGFADKQLAKWEAAGRPEDFRLYCLVPGTKVLTADLRWVDVASLVEGDELVGVDEEPTTPRAHRKYRTSTVEASRIERQQTADVTLADGRTVRASLGHRWLARRHYWEGSRWIATCDLRTGDDIYSMLDTTHEQEQSYDAGWLGGMFDGEGSVRNPGLQLSIAQNEGVVLDRLRHLLAARGYSFSESHAQSCRQLRLSKTQEILRLLMTLRPERLLAKRPWDGVAVYAQKVAVVGVTPSGGQEVVALQTSTGTLIAEGLISHNTSLNQAGNIDQHDQRGFKKAPRSGRLSSSSPDKLPPGAVGAPGGNLMNQPNEGSDGGFMEGVEGSKGIFVAPRGHMLWAKDYKQLEIRIRAARSRDANLMEAVQSKDGPHVDFQNRIKQMTGRTIAKVAAKQGNFNAAYGGHIDMLRTILQKQRVFMEDDDLALIVDANKAAYSGAYAYDDAVIEFARRNGYSETAFGRRRYDEDIFNGDRRVAMHAERALLNHVTQGTAADMLKIAMRLVVPVLKHYGGHMALQIHDELMGWSPEETIEEFCYNLDLAVAPVQLPGVTFEMDGGWGRTWRDAKP